ncbi:hypothetical protein PoB_004545400 [Plakobranchus ocellatus]|uniref:Uncharacterized protein n=1 Tax=Plakobranchus ocellatus TaxID=259542 RepID=A0AAV4BFT3_9GAST|nr:hypothetical protein PoB_004545400 [Plakobranchus ocellatus]
MRCPWKRVHVCECKREGEDVFNLALKIDLTLSSLFLLYSSLHTGHATPGRGLPSFTYTCRHKTILADAIGTKGRTRFYLKEKKLEPLAEQLKAVSSLRYMLCFSVTQLNRKK